MTYKDIAALFEEIELRLVKSLKRNLSRHKDWEKAEGFKWSAWQAEKLKDLERFRRENYAILGEYKTRIDEETRELMTEQFHEGEELTLKQLTEYEITDGVKVENTPKFFSLNEDKMNRLIDDITTLEKDCTTAAIRCMDDVYRQVIHKAQLAMASGQTTLQPAIDDAVKDFLEKGINNIVCLSAAQTADGRRVNIADYVRMALRTTSARATLQGKSVALKRLGYDTVLVSQYGGCSKTCEPWQGLVYIDDVFSPWSGENDGIQGRSNYCGKLFYLLSYAIKNGLFHPNCCLNCVQTAYFFAVHRRHYDDPQTYPERKNGKAAKARSETKGYGAENPKAKAFCSRNAR